MACGAFFVVGVCCIGGWWVTAFLDQRHWKVDWGAWATFATGTLAIVAAWFVGQRQVEIQRQQIKLGLLERRLQIIEDLGVLYHMHPVIGYDDRDIKKLSLAMSLAQLIFPISLSDRIQSVKSLFDASNDQYAAAHKQLPHDNIGIIDSIETANKALEELPEIISLLIAHARVDL